MFFGSHFGDWTHTDNVMRSALATPSLGLTACIVGLPHWFCHHMAMGEPIGYAVRLTMNNTTLYQNQSNALPRAVFINLLGDPTLRLESVAPPSQLKALSTNGAVALSWSPSPDAVLGYHVYRSASPGGPFTRLTDSPLIDTAYTDWSVFFSSPRTYMVRAVALQTNPSGSYFNPSEGVFVQATVSPQSLPPAIKVAFEIGPVGVELAWNSQPGLRYHVEAKPGLQDSWSNISGQFVATSTTTSFVDTNWALYQTRLYRVVNE
jgi:hypothetical protein